MSLLRLCIVSCALVATTFAAETRRPNILFILVDDQSPLDLKAYNPKSPLHSPNLDRLAAQGMVLDGAYHMGSFIGGVCTPSRHMIMSGRTVWHLPIGPGAAAHCPPNLPQNTLPAVFNRAGYDTMRTCKLGNSYEAANQLFTVRKDASKRGGTDETGSAWHGEQVLAYLQNREATKDRIRFSSILASRTRTTRATASPLSSLLMARPTTPTRRRSRPRIPSNPPFPKTICPPIPFRTAIPVFATRSP